MREANSRDTILNCALDLFSKAGYDAVGVSRIADAAGVKKPTLYYFFGSKQGLYEEILDTHFSKLFERLDPLCQRLPVDRKDDEELLGILTSIVKEYFGFAKEYKQFYLMALSPSFASPSSTAAIAIKPYVDKNYQLVEKVFTGISGAYQTMQGKEQIASWEFVALIDVHVGLWNHGYSQLEDDDAKHIAHQFLYGFLG